MAGFFSDMLDLMSAAGVFNYMALLLALIVLYYLFLHLIGKYVKSERLKKGRRPKVISAMLSALLTAFLYIAFFSAAGGAAMLLIAAIFVIAVVFLLITAGGKIAGIDVLELLGVKDEKQS
jgi:hypothetical protein